MEMTLREVCNSAGVSRRAVQGFEKAGLVSATGRTERGYLLYDVTSQERIKQIKLYQQLGFKIKEIKNILDAPSNILKHAIENRISELKKEGKQIEGLIDKAYALLESLN